MANPLTSRRSTAETENAGGNQNSEEEIIRTYGKRWDIEVFFKSCKSYLKPVKECRSLSYDALNAHVAVVFTRYMMLSAVMEYFHITESQLEEFTAIFIDRLPKYMQDALGEANPAA